MPENDDAFHAGRLIQWALNVKAIPFNEPEYRALLDRYIDDSGFRASVRRFADGLGLTVLEANDRGLFLGTQDGSVFCRSPSEFRSSRTSADDRLLDGLVQVGIAATIYPRQQDLDEDSLEAKRPVTVGEVDETLRTLCTEHKRRAAENPDASSDEVDQGLQEAWRVYESRPGLKMTAQGNLSPTSTQSLIRRHLQQLVDHGCFVVSGQGNTELYRPTLRYQIQVKELAASKLFLHVQSLMADAQDDPARSALMGGPDA
ncbi:MAG: hypothetical protein KDA91_22415 [Planctomycetaceae bacterium]|nr:hypothetical protein [Planctomycetaceae bacterium]